MTALRPLARVFVVLTVITVARASRAEDAVTLELVPKGLAGHDQPRVVAHVNAPLSGLVLDLESSDGRTLHQTAGKLGPGSTREFPLGQSEGTFHYNGRMLAKFPRGAAQEMTLDFDASLFGPPGLEVKDDAVDLEKRTLTLAMKRAPAKLHVTVFADDGARLGDFDEHEEGKKAGEPLTVHWEQPETAVILRISVRAFDALGYFQDLDLFPWHVEVPHEDVLFDTGKSDIVPAETPKLDAAQAELVKVIQRYGKLATVQLFIAGCTDTVGDASSNQQLSESRALAIARYFRQKGIRIAIHYAGLGEKGLLVPTADETPEPRNRRAMYVVAVQPPPGVKWAKLP
jgi:outer membrane protein OmpA-like peptidoglycan-associated protein